MWKNEIKTEEIKRYAGKSDSDVVMGIFLLMHRGILVYICIPTMLLKENNFSMESTHQVIQNLMKKMAWKQIPALMEKTDPLALICCCYKLAELH